MFGISNSASICDVADWVELFIAYFQVELSKSRLSSHIEESTGNEPDETFVDSIWQELEFRENLYGDQPPFRVDSRTVKSEIDWNNRPEYMACLIFSLVGNPTNSLRSGTLFERMTSEAMRNFLQGESIACGSSAAARVNEICRRTNEKFNCMPPRRRKDRNLDVVAWKSFGDSRASQLIILMQCKSGHDWKDKLKELNLTAWCRYIHFACPPIKGFSIPVIISNPEDLEEISVDAGLIMDRVRIYRNFVSSSPADNTLRGDLVKWCDRRLREINR